VTIEAMAAKAMTAALAAALPELAKSPTVIDEPAGLPTDYPACAVMIDKFQILPLSGDEIYLTDAGTAAIGTDALFGSGTVVRLAKSEPLFCVGMMRGAGRIWIASRTGPQRESMAERAMKVFFTDDMAPGRLLMQLDGLRVDGRQLPFAWPVAVTIGDATWVNEFVFTERRWAWLAFDLDVSILMTRNAPIASDLRIVLQAPADETFQINSNGTATQI
jgi:hypothetical protein